MRTLTIVAVLATLSGCTTEHYVAKDYGGALYGITFPEFVANPRREREHKPEKPEHKPGKPEHGHNPDSGGYGFGQGWGNQGQGWGNAGNDHGHGHGHERGGSGRGW
ncbi:hypothetical protein M2281_000139 [Mesorhizobium soli]|uniref:hypothetical protein n=1 Tax=Pseudaminobacter soli (ex Li et al. 2025) TaxID=1295366 RepID=UPI00247343CC|nr:hypothetical protein [Mesorhizobium soli]MDH6229567.1 hypothetical protein [Mesorhizobium soli]